MLGGKGRNMGGTRTKATKRGQGGKRNRRNSAFAMRQNLKGLSEL